MSAGERIDAGEECLKLTCYFGEGERSGRHLVADALLDLFGDEEIESSILLRGVQGFGLEHHLRTDRLLTLSEDLPVVAIAVDRRERIERLLGSVAAIQRRGLVTLERARMLTDEDRDEVRSRRPPMTRPATTARSGETPASAGAGQESATKLTVYLGRHERSRRRPAFVEVCELLDGAGVAGASVLLGVDGTRHGERRRAKFFAANAAVPMTILAVGESERIADVLPRLGEVLEDPLLTLERVRVCKRDGEPIEAPHELPDTDGHGHALWQKLTVIGSEAARHDGRAVHLELIRRLRQAGAAGATSLRGIWGFHGDHPPHGDKLLSLRRHVPMLTCIVDTPQRIAELFPIVAELTRERGLVTSEIVPAMSADGLQGPLLPL